MVSIAAILFAVFAGIVILFQMGLVIGMPWGEYAMGGRFPGIYPWKMRIASMVQMIIQLLFAFVVLVRAEIILSDYFRMSVTAIWFVVGFLVLATVLNLITPSKKERAIWAPISILMLISSLIVALS